VLCKTKKIPGINTGNLTGASDHSLKSILQISVREIFHLMAAKWEEE
jgi:hypothetical protein